MYQLDFTPSLPLRPATWCDVALAVARLLTGIALGLFAGALHLYLH